MENFESMEKVMFDHEKASAALSEHGDLSTGAENKDAKLSLADNEIKNTKKIEKEIRFENIEGKLFASHKKRDGEWTKPAPVSKIQRQRGNQFTGMTSLGEINLSAEEQVEITQDQTSEQEQIGLRIDKITKHYALAGVEIYQQTDHDKIIINSTLWEAEQKKRAEERIIYQEKQEALVHAIINTPANAIFERMTKRERERYSLRFSGISRVFQEMFPEKDRFFCRPLDRALSKKTQEVLMLIPELIESDKKARKEKYLK